MKKRLYRLHIENASGKWTEDYYLEHVNEAYEMIARFNKTLRPGEAQRKLISVVDMDKSTGESVTLHNWEKTNNYTLIRAGRTYDTYKCETCGITGKRYGLSSTVTRDVKYKAEKYTHCNWQSK